MRLFFALLIKKGRDPQNVNKVPFKAVLPMKLRNHVSGKSDRLKPVPCLQELTFLFAKLREHEFNDELCAKETAALRAANREYLTTRRETKQTRNEGKLVPGKDLHYKQLNNYLKLYPNPK
ncbi:hypothetical protein HA402_016183 [Bradysia odoriphaga]|nr:hypothetical protein HA402_016183 [Bradysia odoriphaga]